MGWLRLVVTLSTILLTITVGTAEDFVWSIDPAYETRVASGDTTLSFSDREGETVTLYSESHAVLIMQGAYSGSWSPAVQGAEVSQRLLVKALEARRFHVLVWKDLGSSELEAVVKDVAANFSDSPNARLFFYYFGHGVARGSADTGGTKFYLVPVDAPQAHERSFASKAMSGRTLLSYFDELHVKHAFFAFEACRSGGILGSMTETPGRNPAGYLTSSASRQASRQYLTAGTELEDIPADAAFSATLVGALSSQDADSNGDNYITATEATAYVIGNLPTIRLGGDYTQSPEHRREPAGSNGDFIFGPYDPSNFDPYLATTEEVPAPNNLPVVDFPLFRGEVTPFDVGNAKFIKFVDTNRGKMAYLELRIDASAIDLGRQVGETCSKELSSEEGQPTEDTSDVMKPEEDGRTLKVTLPTIRDEELAAQLSSLYDDVDISVTNRLFNEDGSLKTDELYCYYSTTLRLLEPAGDVACGPGCNYTDASGVFRITFNYSSYTGYQYELVEQEASAEWTAALQVALDARDDVKPR